MRTLDLDYESDNQKAIELEHNLDMISRPDLKKPIEFDSEPSIPWQSLGLLTLGLVVGWCAAQWWSSNQIADAIGEQQSALKALHSTQRELKIEKSIVASRVETAMQFTHHIHADVVEAAKALYDCKHEYLKGFACKAVISEADRLNLPVSVEVLPTRNVESSKAAGRQ